MKLMYWLGSGAAMLGSYNIADGFIDHDGWQLGIGFTWMGLAAIFMTLWSLAYMEGHK